jgi:hypothetical protein
VVQSKVNVKTTLRVPLHAVTVGQTLVQLCRISLKATLRAHGQTFERKCELHQAVGVCGEDCFHQRSGGGEEIYQHPSLSLRVPVLSPRGDGLKPTIGAVVEVEDRPQQRLIARAKETPKVVAVVLQHPKHAVDAVRQRRVPAAQYAV